MHRSPTRTVCRNEPVPSSALENNVTLRPSRLNVPLLTFLILNLVVLIDAGTMFGPTRSSQPRIGGPPKSVQSLAQVSLGMLLPSSHCSGPSTMSFPQHPSPEGQSAAVTHGVPAVVHLPAM